MVNTRRGRARGRGWPPGQGRGRASRAPVYEHEEDVAPPPQAVPGRTIDDLFGVMERIAIALIPLIRREPEPVEPPAQEYVVRPEFTHPMPQHVSPAPRFGPPFPGYTPAVPPYLPPTPPHYATPPMFRAPPPFPAQHRRTDYIEFLKMNPPNFRGGGDKKVTSLWVESMERLFAIMECTEEQKVTFAVHMLRGEAYKWWKNVLVRWNRDNTRRNWENFLWEFGNQYIPNSSMDQWEEEFNSLRQGKMNVDQYEAEFSKRADRVPHLVSTEERMTSKFVRGLNPDIRGSLISLGITDYSEMHQRARATERGQFLIQSDLQLAARPSGPSNWQQNKIKNFDQGRRDPPKRVPGRQANIVAWCTFCGKGRHRESDCWKKQGRCLRCGSREHDVTACPRPPPQARVNPPKPENRPRQTGRAYALTGEEILDDAAVVRGTVLICSCDARILIDSGSSHSFVSREFSSKFNALPESLPYVLEVSTPLGRTVVVDEVYRNCDVLIGDKILMADLIPLPLQDFDAILGMDWLFKYYAQVDCHRKVVTFTIPGEETFQFIGVGGITSVPIISAVKARKLLAKGCEGYLAQVVEVSRKIVEIKDVSIVNEYEDVFPKDLIALPPDREIEFEIELLPGTSPLSKAPYRMAPAELKELKL